MGDRLIRTDKNGTQYFVSNVCPRCGGTGYLRGYEHIENGRCFKCGGTGCFETKYKVYTPEYEQKLADRRLEKARKSAAERNRKYMLSEGFNEEGITWIVMGNTYSIKDQLKADGARWDPMLGWHFNHETQYDCVTVTFEEMTRESADGTRYYDDGVEKIKALRDEYAAAHCTSEYIGSVGEKIDIELKYVGMSQYETHMTYYGETHYIIKFEDANGNKVIWNTSSHDSASLFTNHDGETFRIIATVKDHSEYKGEKQTCLKRAKVA